MRSFIEFVQVNFKSNQKKQQIINVAKILIDLFTIPENSTESQPTFAYVKSESFQRRQKAHDNTERYWLDPNSHLHEWLKNHGISYEMFLVPSYAQGGSGRAYFLDKYVVKMSTNRVEANVADMVKNRHDIQTPVIDVVLLDKEVYAILQHRVQTDLPEKIKKAADYLTMIVDDYPDMIGFPDTRHEQQEICENILQRYNGNKSLLPNMMLILDILIKIYKSTGFKHDDAGPTNIGIHKGKVVITDLGPNETGEYDSSKALEKINKNRERLGLPKKDFF